MIQNATIYNMWARGKCLVLTIVRADFRVLEKELKLEGDFETWLTRQKVELEWAQEKTKYSLVYK